MNAWKAFLDDEAGGEVLEYALVAAGVVVLLMAVIACVRNNLIARTWQSLDDGLLD